MVQLGADGLRARPSGHGDDDADRHGEHQGHVSVYDPWGELEGSTGTGYNPMRYAGTHQDTTTGYYRMGARYYEPDAGRFSQADPLPSSVFSPNRYGYTAADPVDQSDPSGRAFSCDGPCPEDFQSLIEGMRLFYGGAESTAYGGACSFSAETPVATDRGEKPIGKLKAGDRVLAYDPKTLSDA